MQNISCLPFSKLRTIRLFGRELSIRNYCCARDDSPYVENPAPKLQLTIEPTSNCPASCPFCIAKGTNRKNRLDPADLEKVLGALQEHNIIRGVTISGGEPFLDVSLLDEIVCLIFEILGPHTEISINTNGMNLKRLHEIRQLPKVDALHISRHHYDEARNQKLFGIELPSNDELREILHSITYRDLFVLNCMLLRDWIGSVEEVHRFLDFAIDMGAGKVSFITGIPINDFVRQQTFDYRDVLKADDPALLFTRSYQDLQWCRCQDGIYASERGELIEFYGRATTPGDCAYCRGLLYTPEGQLFAGYGGQRIL